MNGFQSSTLISGALQIVGVNAETVTDITSTDFPGHFPGEDHAWSLAKFKKVRSPFCCITLSLTSLKHFKVEIHDIPDPHNCSFSLVGIDASIANALRRILLAEIPTLAIEYVYVLNNTSIVQDEVLAQRLGLVPLKGSKEGLHWMQPFRRPTEEDPVGSDPSDYNTVVLKLVVECTLNTEAKKGEFDPLKLYHNAHGETSPSSEPANAEQRSQAKRRDQSTPHR